MAASAAYQAKSGVARNLGGGGVAKTAWHRCIRRLLRNGIWRAWRCRVSCWQQRAERQ